MCCMCEENFFRRPPVPSRPQEATRSQVKEVFLSTPSGFVVAVLLSSRMDKGAHVDAPLMGHTSDKAHTHCAGLPLWELWL